MKTTLIFNFFYFTLFLKIIFRNNSQPVLKNFKNSFLFLKTKETFFKIIRQTKSNMCILKIK